MSNNRIETRFDVSGLGFTVTTANILVAAVIIAGMVRDGNSAVVGILAGAGYFALSNTLALLTITGTLTNWIVSRQEQGTERLRIKEYYKIVAERNLPVATTPEMLPESKNRGYTAIPDSFDSFVPAVDADARRRALAYVVTLYGADGKPDPTMVHLDTKESRDGRLRCKRPEGDALDWLMQRRVLRKVPGGYRLAVERFPTATEAHNAL